MIYIFPATSKFHEFLFCFKVLDKAVLNKPLNVEITVVNPLNEILNECELRVEGSGLVKGQLKRM